MAWRVARSLLALRAEVDALALARSRVSDGTIGDAGHAGRRSDHNPNPAGVVCALDLTHDPAHGADMGVIVRQVVAGQHPALKYVIWQRTIWSRLRGFAPVAYTGSNPHTRHAHFSVGRGSDGRSTGPYDDGSPWGLASLPAPPPAPSPAPAAPGDTPPTKGQIMALPALKKGATGQPVRNLQGLLVAHGNTVTVDGVFGSRTDRSLRAWQKRTGKLAADGICGPKTWVWLTGVK